MSIGKHLRGVEITSGINVGSTMQVRRVEDSDGVKVAIGQAPDQRLWKRKVKRAKYK